MAIAGVVMGAIYSSYKSQQDSYVAQEQVAEMQQNLRASFYMMVRDIRMAAFNPTGAPNVGAFVAAIPDDPGGETATDSTNMAFTIDEDENGAINADDHNEQIAYRVDSDRLEKFMYDGASWNWQPVAENIDAINFVYLNSNGVPIDPTTATNLPLIRSVQVTLLAKTKSETRDFTNNRTYENQMDSVNPPENAFYWSFTAPGDKFRRRLLSTEIGCRNMGI
jgi:type IV pilus assembly protein PilW